METEEKKELTLEEMRELITVSSLLPALTTRIETQLRDLKERYNKIVEAVTSYHAEVTSAIDELRKEAAELTRRTDP